MEDVNNVLDRIISGPDDFITILTARNIMSGLFWILLRKAVLTLLNLMMIYGVQSN